ncbi:hypothetical protein PVL29_020712 [Vitis rotundifolia]|uniref:Reverse transcriptase Ty1/copia-type domain-containing protein n=1 Tax=Vitis rotundifolia TaxID=103349 RepID=A0AA38YXN1_VITRO|nr:hypothetical protein PVL29_020712 [Vitis rotundifolia]
MVSFSISDASCETSKIDHQTKSWKENTANQSSNSKKCNHCPCTTEQRNQFSVEGRISASCNTNQNTEASCVNPTGTPTIVAIEISTNDSSLKSQMVTFAAIRSDISELNTYRTTLKIPHWLKAMQEEIKALIQNRTWDLVPRPPTANIVGSKWVFKTKLKEDGTIDRYKARLVARGFSQIPGLDFGETFSPIIKHTTIRLILSLAITLGWTMSDLISTLSSEFSLKDLGSLHYFLGLEVKHLPNGLFVSQTKYTRDLLEHTKMMKCTHINTPMALKSIITPSDEQPIDPTRYRQLVGSLQYLTFIRPDIVHAVNKACQHFQAPTKADLRAVKRILIRPQLVFYLIHQSTDVPLIQSPDGSYQQNL